MAVRSFIHSSLCLFLHQFIHSFLYPFLCLSLHISFITSSISPAVYTQIHTLPRCFTYPFQFIVHCLVPSDRGITQLAKRREIASLRFLIFSFTACLQISLYVPFLSFLSFLSPALVSWRLRCLSDVTYRMVIINNVSEEMRKEPVVTYLRNYPSFVSSNESFARETWIMSRS
jgi:hypothetical protein